MGHSVVKPCSLLGRGARASTANGLPAVVVDGDRGRKWQIVRKRAGYCGLYCDLMRDFQAHGSRRAACKSHKDSRKKNVRTYIMTAATAPAADLNRNNSIPTSGHEQDDADLADHEDEPESGDKSRLYIAVCIDSG